MDLTNKHILDVTCGARMIWFNKNHPLAVYCDIREGEFEKQFGINHGGLKRIYIKPDVIADFRHLPFPDDRFDLVVFDPPHMARLSETSWIRASYGNLDKDWHSVIKDGFNECMRVCRPYGTLIFKWSDVEFPTSEVIKAIGQEPLFGHHSGKKSNTHWMCFMKTEAEINEKQMFQKD